MNRVLERLARRRRQRLPTGRGHQIPNVTRAHLRDLHVASTDQTPDQQVRESERNAELARERALRQPLPGRDRLENLVIVFGFGTGHARGKAADTSCASVTVHRTGGPTAASASSGGGGRLVHDVNS